MVSDLVIDVQKLGKEYQIGAVKERYLTLRDTISKVAKSLVGRGEPAVKTESFWAVRDASFQVFEGEVLGIVGRNGAGKSTLLKLLSRITAPSEGEIRVRGRIGTLLEVGTGFHQELTGRENIYMNGAILGMSRHEIERKLDEIIAFSEIEKFIDTPVKRYSSGMHIRLAFAVAAHLEPEILMVDEVLAVGDIAFQRKCLGKMGDIAGSGRTVLFVSHNMAAVQQLCNRVIVLEQGQMIADTTTEQGLQIYLSAFRSALDISGLVNFERTVKHLGIRARLTRMRLENMQGQTVDTLNYGEDFAIELECEVYEPIEDVSFWVVIESHFGDPIVMLTSREVGQLFTAAPGEAVVGRLKVEDLLLNPGTYYLSLGMFMLNRGVDNVQKVVTFTVTDIPMDHVFDSQMNEGYLHHAFQEWSISEPQPKPRIRAF